MNEKLTQMQKVILLYVGVKDKKYIRRIDVIRGVRCEVKINMFQERLANIISYSTRSLVGKKLLSIRGKTIGLTDRGRDAAQNILEGLEKIYGDIDDWDIIKKCYDLSSL